MLRHGAASRGCVTGLRHGAASRGCATGGSPGVRFAGGQLNLEVTKSFGKTEIKRLLTEIGKIEIKSIEDLKGFLVIA
ncbi:MAG: hypothetical protein RQ745_08285, partial [Longimicrobiales bacterium]|nr:hypothetical protein [Longimicrobiales bacterium]